MATFVIISFFPYNYTSQVSCGISLGTCSFLYWTVMSSKFMSLWPFVHILQKILIWVAPYPFYKSFFPFPPKGSICYDIAQAGRKFLNPNDLHAWASQILELSMYLYCDEVVQLLLCLSQEVRKIKMNK